MKRVKSSVGQKSAKKLKGGSAEVPIKLLELFRKHYGNTALHDKYSEAFRLIKGEASHVTRVLYPGCFVHITPSLVFPEVVYVDSFKGKGNRVEKFFENERVLDTLVRTPGKCTDHRLTFHQKDYTGDFGEDLSSFDLVISLSAGKISEACAKYLKPGGLLFANNDHGDASLAFTEPTMELRSVILHNNSGKLVWQAQDSFLKQCFKLKRTGESITRDQAVENCTVGRSKWRFPLTNSAKIFGFVFRRN